MASIGTLVARALERANWSEALALLDGIGDAADTPELLELRAQAAYGNGDFEASVAAWERHHALRREQGDDVGAARAAAMVAVFLLIDTGMMAPVRGWTRRAERLLDGAGETPVHPLIAAVRAYERFMCGEMVDARRLSTVAIESGRRLDNPAAVVLARTAAARITILEGDVESGLAQLEEVGALLMSGEVDPLTTGMMLCEIVCAAQGLLLHDVAAEWTDAMDRWSHGAAFGGLHGRCRVHRAEILRVTGPSDAAELEALGACDDLRPWMRREFGWPLAELGTIRLRRGDLDGAEEAFVAAHEHVWCPHPGLALVRLAQGDTAGAMALITDAIDHPFRAPSKERPPFGELSLAPLLEAQVEIAAACGDLDVARRATAALHDIAATYGSPWLLASARLAEARVALLDGDLDAAIDASVSAVAGWADIGAPYETAVARMTLAEAQNRAGRAEIARMERSAAAEAFDRYGATRQAAHARVLLADAAGEPAESPGITPAGSATFRLDGDSRVITFAGQSTVLRDLKGFRYLARMLADPGREFHVLDLVAVEQGTLPTGDAAVVGVADLELSGPIDVPALDDAARDAYRRRLADVDEDIEDARRCNDPARAELAERDREFLIAELSRAVGLGGRLRAVGSDAERARTAVARTLKYSITRIGEAIPALAEHLDNGLRTGIYCSYRPDPLARVDWSI